MNCKWGIGVTKWQRKNEGVPRGGETFPRSLLYTFLPSWRQLCPSVVTSFRWTLTPTIYLINFMRCLPLRLFDKMKKVTPTSSQIRGRNSWVRALVPWLLLLVNLQMERNDSSRRVRRSIIATFDFYAWICFN